MSCWEGIKEGWYGRSCILRLVTCLLILSILFLVVSITCPYWAYTFGEDGKLKNVGVFGYLLRSDLTVPQGAVPFLYAVLAVISFIVLLCDVVLDVMFVTKNFYLVVPTVIVFSFIAGCMTSTVIILWGLTHYEAPASCLAWAFYLIIISGLLDFLAAVLSLVEFVRFGGGPTWPWRRVDSTLRIADDLEREAERQRLRRESSRNAGSQTTESLMADEEIFTVAEHTV